MRKRKQSHSELEVLPGLQIKGEPSAIAAHLGKWVAIVDGTIRASGRNFGEAFDGANAQGLDDAEFVFLPARLMGLFLVPRFASNPLVSLDSALQVE